MTIYLGNQLIAASPERSTVGRNIGEIIPSTLPLNDFSLHLLDGSVLNGNGSYGVFVDHIKNLYGESTKYLNANVIGTLTNTDGVISGFSVDNYLQVPYISTSWTTSFEFKTKLTTGSSVNTKQSIFSIGTESTASLNGVLYQGYLRIYAGSGSGSWNIVDGGSTASSYVMTTNTIYYLKFKFTGTSYVISLSTDDNTYTDILTVNNSTVFNKDSNLFIGSFPTNDDLDSGSFPWFGSIDMTETTLSLDGSQVWIGYTPSWTISEGGWQHCVETYGSCGKFVYDAANNTVRLPKIEGFIEGATDIASLGSITEAGLPNFTGSFDVQNYTNDSAIIQEPHGAVTREQVNQGGTWGTVYAVNRDNQNTWITQISAASSRATIDPSVVEPIYGNSTTVQPQTVNVLYYIVVNTWINTNSGLDIEQITSDLADKADIAYVNQVAANKADIDFSNVNSTGRGKVVQWSLPSNTTTPLSIMANVPTIYIYTAPSNGWIVVYGVSNITDTNVPVAFITLINISNNIGMQSWVSHFSNNEARAYIPVKYGDNYIINYHQMTSMVHLFVSPASSY